MRNGAWLAFHAAQSLQRLDGAPSSASAAMVRNGNKYHGVDKNPKVNFLKRALPMAHVNTDKDLEDQPFVG